jgi:hypothetical protein
MTSRTALTIDSTCDITHAQVQQRRSPRVSSLCSGRVGEQTKMHSMLSHQNGEQAGVACFVSHTFDFRLPGFSVTSGELVLQPSANLGTSRGGWVGRARHAVITARVPGAHPGARPLPACCRCRRRGESCAQTSASAMYPHTRTGHRVRERDAGGPGRTAARFARKRSSWSTAMALRKSRLDVYKSPSDKPMAPAHLQKKKNSKRNRW